MWDIVTLFISDGDDPLLYLRMGDLNGRTWLPHKADCGFELAKHQVISGVLLIFINTNDNF